MHLIDILVLQDIPGIGNKSLIALMAFCTANGIESIAELRNQNFHKETSLKRASAPLVEFFKNENDAELLAQAKSEIMNWKAIGIEAVPFGSKFYPKQLTEVNDPPAILYCRGNLELLKLSKSIAVVGTRENTQLGMKIAQRTVEQFSNSGFCIVSGLAIGIDAIAHQSALDSNGKTIAVLVDVRNVSPSQNRELSERIIESGGLLISENKPNTRIIPALFAKRDRIQSGLAMAVFAIETSVNGGTMHAVKAANAMKRKVYVPDVVKAKYPDLEEKAIGGTQMLVKEGRAEAYSRESYEIISKELSELAKLYCNAKDDSGGIL